LARVWRGYGADGRRGGKQARIDMTMILIKSTAKRKMEKKRVPKHPPGEWPWPIA
jgi:hypothetical protein